MGVKLERCTIVYHFALAFEGNVNMFVRIMLKCLGFVRGMYICLHTVYFSRTCFFILPPVHLGLLI